MPRGNRHLIAAALCFSALFFSVPTAAGESLEYALKGAYLYKFIPFVTWPASAFPSASSPLTICIYGDDPFGPALAQAVRAQKDGRPLALVGIQSPDALASCQLVFAGKSAPLADILHAVEGKPVLTVTESTGAPRGIINFVLEANHVRFDIDDAMAARSGLTISSKLLGLAHIVIPRSAP